MSLSFINFLGNRLNNVNKIYVKPNIPRGKAINAIESYNWDVNYEDIIVLIDETVFGSAKENVIFTDYAILIKEPFKRPKIIGLSEIEELSFKYALMGNSIVVNGEKCTLTQANGRDIAYIVEKYREYLYALDEDMEEDNINNENIILEGELEDVNELRTMEELKLRVEQLEQQLRESSYSEQQKVNSENILEYTPSNSIFKKLDISDNFIDVIRKRTGFGNSLLDSIFSDGDTGLLINQAFNYLARFVIYIRDNYVDKNNVFGLKNNLFVVETVFYGVQLLKLEMINRGYPLGLSQFVLREGLYKFFDVEKIPENRRWIVDPMLSYLDNNTELDKDVLLQMYLFRLFLSNKKGSALLFELEREGELLFNMINEFNGDIEQMCNKYANDIISEIGNIASDNELFRLARNSSNEIYQFARERNLS